MMTGGEDALAHMVWKDSEFYGEFADSEDCPDNGGFCKNFIKWGITFSSASIHEENPILITSAPAYRHGLQNHGQSSWNIKAEFIGLTFTGFDAFTAGGQKQFVMALNEFVPDYMPI